MGIYSAINISRFRLAQHLELITWLGQEIHLRRNQSSVLLLGLGIFGQVHSLDRLGISGGFSGIYSAINISKVTLTVFLRFVTTFRIENGLIEFGIRFALHLSVNSKKRWNIVLWKLYNSTSKQSASRIDKVAFRLGSGIQSRPLIPLVRYISRTRRGDSRLRVDELKSRMIN